MRALITASALLVALTGCVAELPFPEPEPWGGDVGPWGEPNNTNVEIADATLEGRMGRRTFADNVTIQNVFGWDTTTSIEVWSQDGRTDAMTVMTVEGDLQSLEVGDHYEFTMEDWGTGGALFISAIGCSGAAQQGFDFDEPAQEIVIDVVESESGELDAVGLAYTMTFSEGEVQGTVDLTFQ